MKTSGLEADTVVTMGAKRRQRSKRGGRNRVAELQEAANWSAWTNQYVRWPVAGMGGGKFMSSRRTNVVTVMSAALLVFGGIVLVALFAGLLFRLLTG